MKTADTNLYKALGLPVALTLILTVIPTFLCNAQTMSVAASHDPETMTAGRDSHATNNAAAKTTPAAPEADPEISPAVARQLAAMQAEIDELKAELRNREAAVPMSIKVGEEASPKPAITNSGHEDC